MYYTVTEHQIHQTTPFWSTVYVLYLTAWSYCMGKQDIKVPNGMLAGDLGNIAQVPVMITVEQQILLKLVSKPYKVFHFQPPLHTYDNLTLLIC